MKLNKLVINIVGAFFIFLTFFSSAAFSQTKLLMFEADGCYWCEVWHKEVGQVYEKSPEGKIAELQIVPLTNANQKQYDLNSRIVYSPTFVLVNNNKEISRIEGYPGADFFWGMLEKMIENIENTEPNS